MMQVPLATSSSILPVDNFWSSVLVYHDRPNLINRKLAAVAQLLLCEISLDCTRVKQPSEIFRREALLYEIRKLKDWSKIAPDFIKNVTESYDKNIEIYERNWDDLKASFDGIFVSIRILLGRGKGDKCIEVVVFDKKNNIATFFPVQERGAAILAPQFPYHIELTSGGNLRINLDHFEDADTSGAEWLADKLFLKLIKWADHQEDNGDSVKSLTLIEANEYRNVYNELKSKYAEDLVTKWPEKTSTDPKKFVFEDMGIAAYLICLWKKIGDENINFVDCGCGNGLLVYILNREGYSGYGVDIRSRKIWDLFVETSNLKIETVDPSSSFPDSTWIIGNHSDELTPWIPVIALHSSPRTNFFLLPCCPYDFSGQKYIRTDSRISQYSDYLKYIKNISMKCGFDTDIDKLRIPSTKRTCFVGVRKKYVESKLGKIKSEVKNFVDSRLNSDFIARSSVEEVRNCTRLDKNLIKRILNLVISKILATENFIKTNNGQLWNKGGTINLRDLSQIIPQSDLKSLKNQCGGLQTLLKNHRYLFVIRTGAVSLREPLVLNDKTAKYRDKLCWFYLNHPNGCLYSNEMCACKH